MTAHHFPIRVGRRSRPFLRLFGVRDANAFVDVDDTFDARFGRFHVRTPLANISVLADRGPVALDHGDRRPRQHPAP
jgi:hypothetical protein